MGSLEQFQNVVLGGGEVGKYIAWELARWGQRVAVVEGADRRFMSQHCLPARQERDSQREGCGTRSPCFDIRLRLVPWTVDMAGARRRKRELVNSMIAAHSAAE
jgi:glycine/D-amino acid oxidase-like deaminating enzyme